MKWNKAENYVSFYDEKIIVSYWCDWVQWLPSNQIKYNWKNVTLIALRYEDDIMCGGREIEVGLLGFNLRFRWTSKTEEGERFYKKMNTAKDDILHRSFSGWATIKSIEELKNKKDCCMLVWRTRKLARLNGSKKLKKLFIQ